MEDLWVRITGNMVDRVSGPLHLRLVLQPVIASVLAILAGLKDAKGGKPPYFWALATDAAHRDDMFRDGWKSIGKVFVLALVLDVAYQVVTSRFVYIGEAIVVALLLAILPYLILRGLANRIMRTW
jgi:hypothetical protein